MLVPRPPAAHADEDDTLMCRVQSGDVQQLGTLFERHYAPLRGYFLRLGCTPAAAEDLVQDVFVRILKYKATYRSGGKFSTWMYYIARNARLDHLHKRRGEVDWDDAYAPSFEPRDHAQAQQEQRLLAQAMARLADDKRELLVLARYQEMKYEEIAAVLGVETGAIKVRVHRAMRELRDIFLSLEQGGAV